MEQEDLRRSGRHHIGRCRAIDPGERGEVPKYGADGTLISMSPKVSVLVMCICPYVGVRYCGIMLQLPFHLSLILPIIMITMRPALSNPEGVKSQNLRVRTYSSALWLGLQSLRWVDAARMSSMLCYNLWLSAELGNNHVSGRSVKTVKTQ